MIRPQRLAKNIVIIDGFSRSGKTLLAPVLSSMERAELWCLDYLFESLSTLHLLGKIDKKACAMMLQLFSDIDLYHQSIGRNTNFRKDDDSGAAKNGLEEVYRLKAASPAGDATVRQIQKKKSILFLMTHYIFGASDILFGAFKDRLKLYILMERHPLWLVESWYEGQWDKRIGNDPREFQLCCQSGGKVVPWFAAGWAKEYASLGRMEQAIRVMDHFDKSFQARYRRLSNADKKKFLRVPFERFAQGPALFLNRIQKLLKTLPTARTRQIMSEANVPRVFPSTFLEEQAKRMEAILKKEKVRPQYRKMLDRLCDQYAKERL